MTQTDVLVVGAGPTGLTLACDLARRGVAVRIVDRVPEFPGGSRGKGLSPRSLEVFDDLAVIDRMLASGITHMPHRKYQGAEVIAEIDPEAGRVPTPDIPYPTGLMIPQWRVEQILRERLADFGVAVELGAELHGFSQHADGVTATIGQGRIQARYLVGCDGGRSTVRKALGLSLRGQTPDVQLMAVGDVEVDGLGRDAWHQWFTGDGAIMLCPLPGTNAFQVQASHELDQDGSPLEPTLERFQQTFDRIAGVPGVRLHSLAWRSSYRVNVRMVDQLRVGRVFLAGDAAHVHPIAGGLGMNSGIQDAYNLGWKLGLVLGRPRHVRLARHVRNRTAADCELATRYHLGTAQRRPRRDQGKGRRRRRRGLARTHTTHAPLPVEPALPPHREPAHRTSSRATGPRTRRCATPPPARQFASSISSAGRTSPCSAWANAAPLCSATSKRTSLSPTWSGQAASSTTTDTRPTRTAPTP